MSPLDILSPTRPKAESGRAPVGEEARAAPGFETLLDSFEGAAEGRPVPAEEGSEEAAPLTAPAEPRTDGRPGPAGPDTALRELIALAVPPPPAPPAAPPPPDVGLAAVVQRAAARASAAPAPVAPSTAPRITLVGLETHFAPVRSQTVTPVPGSPSPSGAKPAATPAILESAEPRADPVSVGQTAASVPPRPPLDAAPAGASLPPISPGQGRTMATAPDQTRPEAARTAPEPSAPAPHSAPIPADARLAKAPPPPSADPEAGARPAALLPSGLPEEADPAHAVPTARTGAVMATEGTVSRPAAADPADAAPFPAGNPASPAMPAPRPVTADPAATPTTAPIPQAAPGPGRVTLAPAPQGSAAAPAPGAPPDAAVAGSSEESASRQALGDVPRPDGVGERSEECTEIPADEEHIEPSAPRRLTETSAPKGRTEAPVPVQTASAIDTGTPAASPAPAAPARDVSADGAARPVVSLGLPPAPPDAASRAKGRAPLPPPASDAAIGLLAAEVPGGREDGATAPRTASHPEPGPIAPREATVPMPASITFASPSDGPEAEGMPASEVAPSLPAVPTVTQASSRPTPRDIAMVGRMTQMFEAPAPAFAPPPTPMVGPDAPRPAPAREATLEPPAATAPGSMSAMSEPPLAEPVPETSPNRPVIRTEAPIPAARPEAPPASGSANVEASLAALPAALAPEPAATALPDAAAPALAASPDAAAIPEPEADGAPPAEPVSSYRPSAPDDGPAVPASSKPPEPETRPGGRRAAQDPGPIRIGQGPELDQVEPVRPLGPASQDDTPPPHGGEAPASPAPSGPTPPAPPSDPAATLRAAQGAPRPATAPAPLPPVAARGPDPDPADAALIADDPATPERARAVPTRGGLAPAVAATAAQPVRGAAPASVPTPRGDAAATEPSGPAAEAPAEPRRADGPVTEAPVPTAPALPAASVPASPARQIADAVAAQLPPAPPAARPSGPPAEAGPLKILTLQLHPTDLGSVLVRMRLQDGRLEMSLRTAREDTAERLRREGEALTGLLREAGYAPEAVTIESSAASQNGAQGPTQNGASERGGQPPFSADGQDRNPGGATPDQPGRRPTREGNRADRAEEQDHDTASHPRDRSGLYL